MPRGSSLRAPKKRAIGRPRIKIDYDLVGKLSSIGCTGEEVAAVLGIARETFFNRLRNDPELIQKWEWGKEHFKVRIRRKQIQLMEGGSVTMAIWLGKQYLGQRDKIEERLVGFDNGPLRVDLRTLSVNELAVLENLHKTAMAKAKKKKPDEE